MLDPLQKKLTVMELVERYLKTRTRVKPQTKSNYNFVRNVLSKESFSGKKIGTIKTPNAKLFLINLQADGRGYSTVKTVRGVLRPAFQMAVDDDIIVKNPFAFLLVGVVVNDIKTREAITREQMRNFLKFVHDDNTYCKYYEAVHILFHTGMRISEFCGLTLKDVDLKNRVINIDHQLQRTSDICSSFFDRKQVVLTNADGGFLVVHLFHRVILLDIGVAGLLLQATGKEMRSKINHDAHLPNRHRTKNAF